MNLNRVKFWRWGDYRCWMCRERYARDQPLDYLRHLKKCDVETMTMVPKTDTYNTETYYHF
ncbi:MAG: hypothetical protein KGH98_05075 [Candidatus Micrarchaeota archaeon]|nr:hypothetical protein [Candidatus Micrarchaeota archaeon]